MHQPEHDDEQRLRAAAAEGRLPQRHAAGTAGERAMLYRIVRDVVYQHHTRPAERAHGHQRCATSVEALDPQCHDRHQDAVEIMLSYLLTHGAQPIRTIEGWLTSRLRAALIDGHRRQRGERGAQQRPRLPLWLRRLLGTEWEQRLALEIMTWVGVPHSAGLGLWPLTAWADLRQRVTGESGCTEARISVEVEAVLEAMRSKPDWYDRYVERPLGHKVAPVLPASRTGDDGRDEREPSYLVPVGRHELDDARLTELAALAVDEIEARIRAGEDAETAVSAVLRIVFGSGTGSEGMDEPPGSGSDVAVARLLDDPAVAQRVTKAAVEIIRDRDGSAGRCTA